MVIIMNIGASRRTPVSAPTYCYHFLSYLCFLSGSLYVYMYVYTYIYIYIYIHIWRLMTYKYVASDLWIEVQIHRSAHPNSLNRRKQMSHNICAELREWTIQRTNKLYTSYNNKYCFFLLIIHHTNNKGQTKHMIMCRKKTWNTMESPETQMNTWSTIENMKHGRNQI